MSDKLGIGQIITTEQFKDAIHVAVAPMVAGEKLSPGEYVAIRKDGTAMGPTDVDKEVGIVDPFLRRPVKSGERFWLFLIPGSITSLRHDWTHPAFQEATGAVTAQETPREKSESELWMRRWAVKHMGEDYYGEGQFLSEDEAYENAIKAGRDRHVGPYEDARDHINNEWWNHWEIITGEKGERDEYFSCSC